MFGVEFKSSPWTTHTVRRRQAWHAIIAFGLHTLSDTSSVEIHHRPWKAHMVERHRWWLTITALRLHARSDDVRHAMPSSPFGCTHKLMMSTIACYHHLCKTYTVGRHWEWHAIISLRLHIQMEDVGPCILSSPLESTHSKMMLGMSCNHRPWITYTVGQRRA